MKLQIVGIEISEGASKKDGSAYSIGQLHTMAQLAPPLKDGNVSKGYMGTTYRCDVQLLRKVQHLPFPITADVTLEPQMRFGKREDIVVDVAPLETVKKAA